MQRFERWAVNMAPTAGHFQHINGVVRVSLHVLRTTVWRPASPCGTTPTLSPGNCTCLASRRTRRHSGDPKLEPKPGTERNTRTCETAGDSLSKSTLTVTCSLCFSGGISNNLQEKRKKCQNKRKNQSGDPPQFKEVPCKKFRQVGSPRQPVEMVVVFLIIRLDTLKGATFITVLLL